LNISALLIIFHIHPTERLELLIMTTKFDTALVIERLEEITKDDQIRKLKTLLSAAEKKMDKVIRECSESNKLLGRSKSQLAAQREKTKSSQAAYNQLKQTHEQTKKKLDATIKNAEKLDRALCTLSKVDSLDEDANKWNDQEWAILKSKEPNAFRIVDLQNDCSFQVEVVDGKLDITTPIAPPKHIIQKILELAMVDVTEG
jgi:chromosome segregation ATPase